MYRKCFTDGIADVLAAAKRMEDGMLLSVLQDRHCRVQFGDGDQAGMPLAYAYIGDELEHVAVIACSVGYDGQVGVTVTRLADPNGIRAELCLDRFPAGELCDIINKAGYR